MFPTKIVVVGAGSASFGLNTLAALVRSERLHGSQLALVDLNEESLALVGRLAERLNRSEGSIKTKARQLGLRKSKSYLKAIKTGPRKKT